MSFFFWGGGARKKRNKQFNGRHTINSSPARYFLLKTLYFLANLSILPDKRMKLFKHDLRKTSVKLCPCSCIVVKNAKHKQIIVPISYFLTKSLIFSRICLLLHKQTKGFKSELRKAKVSVQL